MLDLAVEYGARKSPLILHEAIRLNQGWKMFGVDLMFGVDFENATALHYSKDYFKGTELKYHQIEHYIKTGEILIGGQDVIDLSRITIGNYLETEIHANSITPKDSHWDTRKDLLLEVQKSCKENNIAIQIYEDEIVVNFTNDDNEYSVANKIELDKLLSTKKELTSFERKY
jgi:aminoglycoside N3'-acetyltransferase